MRIKNLCSITITITNTKHAFFDYDYDYNYRDWFFVDYNYNYNYDYKNQFLTVLYVCMFILLPNYEKYDTFILPKKLY